jgi:hypothetical protein
MDMLEFMEREGRATLAEVMREYAAAGERVFKLATLLVGGAGAVAAFVLARLDTLQLWQWAPMALLAGAWAAAAGRLILRAGGSHVLGYGADTAQLENLFESKGGDFVNPSASPGLFAAIRLAELRRMDGECGKHMVVVAGRRAAIDCAQWVAVGAPFVAGAVAALLFGLCR